MKILLSILAALMIVVISWKLFFSILAVLILAVAAWQLYQGFNEEGGL